jgi:hypothetical protein
MIPPGIISAFLQHNSRKNFKTTKNANLHFRIFRMFRGLAMDFGGILHHSHLLVSRTSIDFDERQRR